jgi:hypothetical protein
MSESQLLKEHEANDLIKQYIKENRTFFVGRSGVTECEIICHMLLDNKRPIKQYENALIGAGIYPNDYDNVYEFSKKYSECMRSLDLVAVIGSKNYPRLIFNYCPDAIPFRLWGLEPYHFPNNPWSEELVGRKILVIHPFEKSIRKNYENREKLFVGTNILPDFELITIKAEQNIGNCDSNWFESLQTMQDKISDVDFDLALIGCGAFGLPLASFIKTELQKTSIHLGGALQLLFGIMGKRWENYNHPTFNRFVNEYWTKPLPEETPRIYKDVENGCYW